MNNLAYATPFEWKQSAKDSDFDAGNIIKNIENRMSQSKRSQNSFTFRFSDCADASCLGLTQS